MKLEAQTPTIHYIHALLQEEKYHVLTLIDERTRPSYSRWEDEIRAPEKVIAYYFYIRFDKFAVKCKQYLDTPVGKCEIYIYWDNEYQSQSGNRYSVEFDNETKNLLADNKFSSHDGITWRKCYRNATLEPITIEERNSVLRTVLEDVKFLSTLSVTPKTK